MSYVHLPALVLGESGASPVLDARAGSVPRNIAAFDQIGGVPTRHIRYDNLTSAVQKVIYGQSRARVEKAAMVALPFALWVRRVLLPTRNLQGTRERLR